MRVLSHIIVRCLSVLVFLVLFTQLARLFPSCSAIVTLPRTAANVATCKYAKAHGPDSVVSAIRAGKLGKPSPELVGQLQDIVRDITFDVDTKTIIIAEAQVDAECETMLGH